LRAEAALWEWGTVEGVEEQASEEEESEKVKGTVSERRHDG
jgi:hypothetical protein